MAASAKDLWEKYQNFVKTNPHSVSQIEGITRVLSYVIPAKLDTSNVFSELLYSASNLLVLLNDTLLRNGIRKYNQSPEKQTKFKNWLAILECLEVFLEVGAEKAGGPTFHWIVIVCIQLVKTILRFLLVKYYPEGLQTTPIVPSLDRKRELKKDQTQPEEYEVLPTCEDTTTSMTFTLERSGRTVRKLSAAPSAMQRNWKLPEAQNEEQAEDPAPTILSPRQLLAEKLYISRPIIHLLSMYVFGQRSWKPWMLASGVDISSLYLMGEREKFNKAERSELTRRSIMLLFYMLRSPFYDKFTKKRLIQFLQNLSKSIPGLRLIINPLMAYLPVWQKYYFYVWNQ